MITIKYDYLPQRRKGRKGLLHKTPYLSFRPVRLSGKNFLSRKSLTVGTHLSDHHTLNGDTLGGETQRRHVVIRRTQGDGAIRIAQEGLERRLLVVDQRHHDLAIARAAAAFHDHHVAVQEH